MYDLAMLGQRSNYFIYIIISIAMFSVKREDWPNHSQAILNDHQTRVLNIYLDGYLGKLTIKK